MYVSAKKVAKYVFLPQVLPRLRDLVSSSFEYTAFFMAQIYRSARLLPPGHAYLNPANVGRYGIRHVVAAAANNLKLKKENTDQIIIFMTVLIGLAIIAMQFCLLALSFFTQAAEAATMPTNFAGFVVTENPKDDIAFMLLDKVLGIPDFFNSCVEAGEDCFTTVNGISGVHTVSQATQGPIPWPIHTALHAMLQFYSIGLLVIAMLIFAYFVVTVVVETAQAGTPFGKRFNHVWAPIRMVWALGLLIPISNGLNSAQYITLYAAKWGSGFATNGWKIFTSDALTGDSTLAAGDVKQKLVANINTPDLTNLLEYDTALQTCWAAYKLQGVNVVGYLVRDSRTGGGFKRFTTTSYQDALKFFNYGDILIRFGVQNNDAYSGELGHVKEYCGEVIVHTTSITKDAATGATWLQEQYYELMKKLWEASGGGATCGPLGGALDAEEMEKWGLCLAELYAKDGPPVPNPAPKPTIVNVRELIKNENAYLSQKIAEAAERERARTDVWEWRLNALGWAGAGIWYNTIAQVNGAMVAAAANLPYVRHYPRVMENVRKAQFKANSDNTGRDAFRPYLADNTAVELEDPGDLPLATAMWEAYNLWTDAYNEPSTDIFVDSIRAVFGIDGLMNIQKNIDVHPLAQLSAVGKSLVETAIRNLGTSLMAGVGGGITMILTSHKAGQVAQIASKFLYQIAMIGLSAGFVLFYVIPFLPFIYFFFAVGTWIKSIFEAMVGVPLWALAHIRIDGNGLPGDAAMGGYYLILEIFLRPILIIFGLIASILIFSAQVRVLNEIWPLVTSNLSGFDNTMADGLAPADTGGLNYLRNIVDSFFFTVIYTMIVYMLGMASFKLVDQIPNYLLRWMGASVQSFADSNASYAEGLVQNVSYGASMVSQGMQGVQSGLQGVTSIGQGLMGRMGGTK